MVDGDRYLDSRLEIKGASHVAYTHSLVVIHYVVVLLSVRLGFKLPTSSWVHSLPMGQSNYLRASKASLSGMIKISQKLIIKKHNNARTISFIWTHCISGHVWVLTSLSHPFKCFSGCWGTVPLYSLDPFHNRFMSLWLELTIPVWIAE